MGIYYRKRIKIMPGLSINLSPKSVGARVGPKHAGVSRNTKDQTTRSVGLFGFRWMRRS